MLGLVAAYFGGSRPQLGENRIAEPDARESDDDFIKHVFSYEGKRPDAKPPERAKFKIKDLLTMVKGAQTGLEIYSRRGRFVISPLTEDNEIIANLLRRLTIDVMPSNGDRLDRAMTWR